MFERRGYVEPFSDVLSPHGEVDDQILATAKRLLVGEHGSCTTLWRRLEHDTVTEVFERYPDTAEYVGQILLAPKRRAPRAAAAILQRLGYPVQMVEDPRGATFTMLELVRDTEADQLTSMRAMALAQTPDGQVSVLHWDALHFWVGSEPLTYQQSELPQVPTVPSAAVLYEGARLAYVAATGRFLLDRRAA